MKNNIVEIFENTTNRYVHAVVGLTLGLPIATSVAIRFQLVTSLGSRDRFCVSRAGRREVSGSTHTVQMA